MPHRCPGCKLAAPRQRPSVPCPREDGFWRQMTAVHLERPGVLLCAVWAPASRGEWSHVRTHWFGNAQQVAEMSTFSGLISMHELEYSHALAALPTISEQCFLRPGRKS